MNKIASLLSASRVVLDVAAPDKKALFERVGSLLDGTSGLNRTQIVGSLIARERLGSTALGEGIAIPHGRVRGLREAVGAFLRLNPALAFDAPDNRPVNLVFVLLVPDRATDLHLQILSDLAQMFSDRRLRSELTAVSDALSAQRLIASWEPHAPNAG